MGAASGLMFTQGASRSLDKGVSLESRLFLILRGTWPVFSPQEHAQ
jgi:hypothetical protein